MQELLEQLLGLKLQRSLEISNGNNRHLNKTGLELSGITNRLLRTGPKKLHLDTTALAFGGSNLAKKQLPPRLQRDSYPSKSVPQSVLCLGDNIGHCQFQR